MTGRPWGAPDDDPSPEWPHVAPSSAWGTSGWQPWASTPVPGSAPPVARAEERPPWAVLLLLLLVPPLGLVLLWRSGRWSVRRRSIITAAIAVLLVGVGATAVTLGQAQGLATAGPAAPASASPSLSPSSPSSPSPSASPSASPSPSPSPSPSAGSAVLAALLALDVAEQVDVPGYDRAAFGPAWTDVDRNGCDTRNDVLRHDLQDVVLAPGSNGCAVLSGSLLDPYTGQQLAFERGQSAVEVDHVVALADAWRSGAESWPYDRLLAYANDPLELAAVGAEVNQSKADSDAAGWLPTVGVCEYVARRVAVKAKYELSVTPEERAALERSLRPCGGQDLPSGGGPTSVPGFVPPSSASPSPSPTAPQVLVDAAPNGRPAGADYGTCARAKAAGAGPYYAGKDPEYSYYRDADGDGVVCE